MSADNGIYILVTKRNGGKKEYRVAYFQCVENLTYRPDYPATHPQVNIDIMLSHFGDSHVFTDRKIAEGYAVRMLEEHTYCEYGIVFLEFPDVRFPRVAQQTMVPQDEYDTPSREWHRMFNTA